MRALILFSGYLSAGFLFWCSLPLIKALWKEPERYRFADTNKYLDLYWGLFCYMCVVGILLSFIAFMLWILYIGFWHTFYDPYQYQCHARNILCHLDRLASCFYLYAEERLRDPHNFDSDVIYAQVQRSFFIPMLNVSWT